MSFSKENVMKNVCVLMPTHCTITCFGLRAMRIHGVSVVYYRVTHLFGRLHYVGGICIYALKEVYVIVFKCEFVIGGMIMKGREKINSGAAT